MTDLTPYGERHPAPPSGLRVGALLFAGALVFVSLAAGLQHDGETVAPAWHGAVDCFGNIVSAVPGVGEQGTVRIAYEPPLLVWYGANDEVLDTAYPTKPENCTPPTTPASTTTTVAPTTTTEETIPSTTTVASTTSTVSPSTTTPEPTVPDSSVPSPTTSPPTSAAPSTTTPVTPLPLPTPPVPPIPPRPQTTQPEPYCTRFPNAEGCVDGLPTAETG